MKQNDQKKNRDSNNPKWLKVVNALTTLLAVGGFAISVRTYYKDLDYRNIAIQPYISMSFDYTKEDAAFNLINAGGGNAIIHWFLVEVEGKRYQTWEDVLKALDFNLQNLREIPDAHWSNIHPDRAIPGGKEIKLLSLPKGPFEEKLIEVVKKRPVTLKACFCSMANLCWTSTNLMTKENNYSVRPKPDPKLCEPVPEGRFGVPD